MATELLAELITQAPAVVALAWLLRRMEKRLVRCEKKNAHLQETVQRLRAELQAHSRSSLPIGK